MKIKIMYETTGYPSCPCAAAAYVDDRYQAYATGGTWELAKREVIERVKDELLRKATIPPSEEVEI